MLSFRKIFRLNVAIVTIVAPDLRVPITAVEPMTDIIQDEYNLNPTLAGVSTGLPLIAFNNISFIAGYFSPVRAIIAGIFLILIAELIRSYLGVYGLFLGMLGIGCDMAIVNMLLPSFVKGKLPREMVSMMGIYSLVLSIFSIAGITLSIPLLNIFNLVGATVFWSVFSFIALMIHYPQAKNDRLSRIKKEENKKINPLRDPTTQKITLFMGFQSFLVYSLSSWYVQIIVGKGYNRGFAANIILFSQLVAAPISLFGPLLLGKLKRSLCTSYIAILRATYAVSFGILLAFDTRLMIMLAAFIVGSFQGSIFGIALLFIAQKSSNVEIAARLSTFAQGFGYLIVTQRQWIIGFFHDMSGNFAGFICILFIVGILVNIFEYLACRSKVI